MIGARHELCLIAVDVLEQGEEDLELVGHRDDLLHDAACRRDQVLDVVHVQAHQCALQAVDALLEMAGQPVEVLAVDRRDEDDGELVDDVLVDLIRLVLELDDIVEMLWQLIDIGHGFLCNQCAAMEVLGVFHQVVKEFLVLVADIEHYVLLLCICLYSSNPRREKCEGCVNIL